ncbi:MAG: hydantoinase B/oxoprolinase family protein [Deltaproteobacteria bacterium]|nr:hydantoinase B/oxoprolinase family protein [Deltaproteobacteria bacterium]
MNMPVSLDPITVEVIESAFASLVEEMGESLIKASYSTNIKERRDCSTALFDARGQTLAQAEHIPIHLGSLIGIVEEVLKRYPEHSISDGDMFIGNDPYAGGGSHLPDMVVVSPVFVQGRLMGFVSNLAHHADFMDRGHAHIFQEGLRIPPIKIFHKDELQEDILNLILYNCQVPDERRGDFQAQFAANKLGIKRFHELCRRFGADTVCEAGAASLDYTERKTRVAISDIPDGVYSFRDRFDSPDLSEILQLQVAIKVRNDEMQLDFSGNPPQGRHGLNIVWTALLATVYYALKTLIDPTIRPNAGFYRPIKVVAPRGSILNCCEPAAVEARTQTCQRVVDLIHGALAPVIPERVTAAHNGANTAIHFGGIHPRTNRYYTYLETLGGGFGARATKDGLDGVQAHITNTSNLPIEALEQEYPLMIERYELIQDSGGPGRWRGGLGLLREVKLLETECSFHFSGTRLQTAPWGLFGGHEGGRAEIIIRRASDKKRADGNALLFPGDSVIVKTAGGGGYGPPKERCRQLVKRDLREGKISKQKAKEIYGLQIDES